MMGSYAPALGLAAVWLIISSGSNGALNAQEVREATAERETPATEDGAEATAVRKTAEEFKRAFDAGDAKAVAALWTLGGSYTEADGEQLVGREMIETAYTDFFKENPGVKIDVRIETVRVLGPNVAIEEGTSRLIYPGDEKQDSVEKEDATGRYSALHVRDSDGWKMASVTEWPIDPTLAVSLDDIAWLVGDWEIASDEAIAQVSYEWDENRTFLRSRYTLKRGGTVESNGTETIARNPAGGLRSWRLESSGAFAESLWTWQENAWLIEAVGMLPDGSEVSAVSLMTPLDENSFLWQSTERTIEGVALPGTRPLKVKRVASAKRSGNASPAAP